MGKMKNLTGTVICLLCLGFTSGALASQKTEPSMQVFTVSAIPMEKDPAVGSLCYLDQGSGALNQINRAMQQGNRTVDPLLLKAATQYQSCAYQAKFLGISKVPAIVFEHQFVVYGVTNPERALELYHEYLSKHGAGQ